MTRLRPRLYISGDCLQSTAIAFIISIFWNWSTNLLALLHRELSSGISLFFTAFIAAQVIHQCFLDFKAEPWPLHINQESPPFHFRSSNSLNVLLSLQNFTISVFIKACSGPLPRLSGHQYQQRGNPSSCMRSQMPCDTQWSRINDNTSPTYFWLQFFYYERYCEAIDTHDLWFL